MEAFNKVELSTPVVESIHARDLELGVRYPLQKLEKTFTKYGDAILAFIPISSEETRKLFLPKPYVKSMTEENINEINAGKFDIICVSSVQNSFKFEVQPSE
ncbi:unnamed protein product [Bemisia tabaci]|uniref:Uncharacterized protein n=1 Tax=Bemisia tabaci TaxID=7038 RepID=A0A9P0F9E3_BEMTA|nr:unnamed protein product [Bemisia tabaci]